MPLTIETSNFTEWFILREDGYDYATPGPQRPVYTALHVCQIFASFNIEEPALSLTQIATRVGLKKSSVHSLLQTLVSVDFLVFEAENRKYHLGPQFGRLSDVYRESNSLTLLARPFLEALRDATGETAVLHTRVGDHRVCLMQMESHEPIRMALEQNTKYPLDAGAAGHVFRAFSSSLDQEPYAARLKQVRQLGFAVSRGELIPGSIAICVPVTTYSGMLVAVLGVHGPAFRNSDNHLPTAVAFLQEAAHELGSRVPSLLDSAE